jgi:flagellar basal-body rod modification protein FlgD
VVRTLDLGARASGSSEVKWDGLDGNGQALPTGDYYLSVTAKTLNGTTVTSGSAVRGIVAGVDFDGSVPQLVVAGQRVKLGDVTQIGLPPPGA